MLNFPLAAYTPPGTTAQTQKTGGQPNIGNAIRGFFGDIGETARQYAGWRLNQELYNTGYPGAIDPLSPPPGSSPNYVPTSGNAGTGGNDILILGAIGLGIYMLAKG
jgi:hypothetical protein